MLKSHFQKYLLEAGCDEAGRGCLAGPVVAAAVILPPNFKNNVINDSKQLTEAQRKELRITIQTAAISYAVAFVDEKTIDQVNILNASILAMHKALNSLQTKPEFILVDGNRFKPYKQTPHKTIIKGDTLYLSIAAASVLAKTYRDEWMEKIHQEYPLYHWSQNKGYPTAYHRQMIKIHGAAPYHRRSFRLTDTQPDLFT